MHYKALQMAVQNPLGSKNFTAGRVVILRDGVSNEEPRKCDADAEYAAFQMECSSRAEVQSTLGHGNA